MVLPNPTYLISGCTECWEDIIISSSQTCPALLCTRQKRSIQLFMMKFMRLIFRAIQTGYMWQGYGVLMVSLTGRLKLRNCKEKGYAKDYFSCVDGYRNFSGRSRGSFRSGDCAGRYKLSGRCTR